MTASEVVEDRRIRALNGRSMWKCRFPSAVAILLVIGCCAVVGVNVVRDGRRQARNLQCRGRLGQIALALHNYRDEHGGFPPRAVRDEDGNPLLSWRVSLLPYLDDGGVFKKLALSEAWDSSQNKAVAEEAPVYVAEMFRSPNDFGSDPGETSFIALSLSGSVRRDRIVIVEIHNSGIHWMQPETFTSEEARLRIAGTVERDGSVRFVTADGQTGTLTKGSITFDRSLDEALKEWSATER